MPELREIIDKSRELYPKAFKGAKFKEVEKFGSFRGAKIEFGFLNVMQMCIVIKDKHIVGLALMR